MTDANDQPQTDIDLSTSEAIGQTEAAEMDARQRLTALKLLKTRHDKMAERQAARKGYWRNTLTELTQALNEAIDVALPVKDSQCRENLIAIKKARAASEDAKAEKASELKGLKDAIAKVEQSMDELMLKDVSTQMALDLGGQSAWLTKDVAEHVNVALSAKETKAADNGESMAADLVALRQQLASMGFEQLVVRDDVDDEDESADGEAEASESSSDDDVYFEPAEGVVDYDEDEDTEDEVDDEDTEDNVIALAGNG